MARSTIKKVEERVNKIADFILENNNCTAYEVSKTFDISLDIVHKDIDDRLPRYDFAKYEKVRDIIYNPRVKKIGEDQNSKNREDIKDLNSQREQFNILIKRLNYLTQEQKRIKKFLEMDDVDEKKKLEIFIASWCFVCPTQEEIDRLKDSFEVEVLKMDFDENMNYANELRIYSLPCFLVNGTRRYQTINDLILNELQ